MNSEFMGKTFQAAQLTHEIFFTIEVDRGSSVWQISKKYFAGVIYGQLVKNLSCAA